MVWFNDFLRALAELTRAIAWPAVAVFLLYRYRDCLGDLIPRIRELFGAKFDPPPPVPQKDMAAGNPVQQLQALAQAGGAAAPQAAPPAAAGPGGLPAVLQAARTPPVVEAEVALLNTPEMLAIADPQTRERALSTFAAAMMVSWTFEKIEAGIWGSQIQLLQSLNTAPAGITREWIKENFFDVAQKQFPAWYSSYSFDQYLGFLSSFNLIAAGPMVAITEHGREYLVWRVRLGKSMKVNG